MACEMAWIVDRRVLVVRCIGPVNPAALTRMNPDFMIFLEEGMAPVHILYDTRLAAAWALSDRLSCPEGAVLDGGGPLGWVLTVTGDPTKAFPAGIGADDHRRVFKDYDTALDFLRQIDANLFEYRSS